jgi:nitrite reductase (NADH) small subunit
MNGWLQICSIDDIPRLGARVIKTGSCDVAVFRTSDDRIFALDDSCPHKQGPLSQGIVHGDFVTCPLHNWVISLSDGNSAAPDEGCTRHYPVRVENKTVFLSLHKTALIKESVQA